MRTSVATSAATNDCGLVCRPLKSIGSLFTELVGFRLHLHSAIPRTLNYTQKLYRPRLWQAGTTDLKDCLKCTDVFPNALNKCHSRESSNPRGRCQRFRMTVARPTS